MNASTSTTTAQTSTTSTPTFAQWNAQRVLEGLEGPKGDILAMRGVCAIFRRQTALEAARASTISKNGVGFSAAHAKVGTKLAQWMTMGYGDGIFRRAVGGNMRFQDQWMSRIEICRYLCRVYREQLAEIANSNLERKSPKTANNEAVAA